MLDIFLSYSREDQAVARRFAQQLQREGFEIWWDQALHPGEAFDEVTERALEQARAVVVLWSKSSVQSRWVRAEATQANADNRLVPVMIEPCKRPIMFELTHTADLSLWKGDGADPAWQSFVASLRRFAAGAAGTSALPSDGSGVPTGGVSAPDQAAATQHGPRRAFLQRVAGAGVAALVLLAGAALWMSNERSASLPQAGSAKSDPPRILVLPLVNRSADPGQQVFADGLTEDVHNQLSRIAGITTLGRETTFALRDARLEPQELRRRYGADFVLGGAVLREGDRLRVIPSLIDARDNTQLPLVAYEQQLNELPGLQLQQDMARDVAAAVGVALGAGDLPPGEGGTRDVQAWVAYQQAVKKSTESGFSAEVLQGLRESLQHDPGFHEARYRLYLWLSPGMSIAPDNFVALQREQEGHARLLEAAPEAWQLTSGFRAARLQQQRRWTEAFDAAGNVADGEREFMQAFILLRAGCFSEAVPNLRAALDRNPGSAIASELLRVSLNLLGRDIEAREELARFVLVTGQAAPGTDDERLNEEILMGSSSTDPGALRWIKQWLPSRDGRLSGPRWVLGGEPVSILDDPPAVGEVLARVLEDPSTHSERGLLSMAFLAAFYGQYDVGLRALRIDLVERNFGWPPALWQYPALRAQAGFSQLVVDLGLPQFWRAKGLRSDFCELTGTGAVQCHAKPSR